MAADVKNARGVEAMLIKGSNGQFEVVADGHLIFSKKQSGRFPELDEVLSKLPS